MTACPFTAPDLADKRVAAHALNKHTGPKGTTLRHGRDLAAGLGKTKTFVPANHHPACLPARATGRGGGPSACPPPHATDGAERLTPGRSSPASEQVH